VAQKVLTCILKWPEKDETGRGRRGGRRPGGGREKA